MQETLTTPIQPMRAGWTVSGACTSGSTARPRDATGLAPGFVATTSTTGLSDVVRRPGEHGPLDAGGFESQSSFPSRVCC